MRGFSEGIDYFTGITVVLLLFLASSGLLMFTNRSVGHAARRSFLANVISLFFIMLADWINYVLGPMFPSEPMIWFHRVSMALSFELAPVLPLVIARTIFPQRSDKWLFWLLTVHSVFQIVGIFTGWVFWVDAANVYHRGSLYACYMLSYTVSATYLTWVGLKAGSVYQQVTPLSVVAILLLLASGVAIQISNGAVRMSWPAVSMAMVLFFEFYSQTVLRTDALTKLLNRHGYEEFLAHPPLPCEVVLVDVDSFKHVNDTYGHAYGDEALVTLAMLIRRAFGRAGLCYRSGGDEFTVVLTKRLDEVDALCDSLQALVADAQAADARLPGVSVGHARADADCPDVTAVVTQADEAMYESKRARKATA